jgi:hypothetical protein
VIEDETQQTVNEPGAEDAAPPDIPEEPDARDQRIRELEIQTNRLAAAAKFQLPADLHEFITAEDAPGALAQAEKLAARLKPKSDLPSAGGRNPIQNAGYPLGEAQYRDDQERFDAMRSRVPALNNRVLRSH